MSDDSELERLKAERLAEMRLNISSQRSQEPEPAGDPKKASYRDILVKNLGYRGAEVLQNAEYQFPREASVISQKLGELLASGEINETIDGGKLLALFRSVGVNVRMDTKIKVEKDGKLVSLSDKLGMGKSGEQ